MKAKQDAHHDNTNIIIEPIKKFERRFVFFRFFKSILQNRRMKTNNEKKKRKKNEQYDCSIVVEIFIRKVIILSIA